MSVSIIEWFFREQKNESVSCKVKLVGLLAYIGAYICTYVFSFSYLYIFNPYVLTLTHPFNS